jgi:hypothetical protein
MPIDASPSGTLDVENATLRSRNIVALTNMVAGNDVVRSSAAPTLEVYGDPSHGGNEARLELVSNTANTISTSFTRLTSNAGVLDIQSGTDASDNGTITFGGFSNERMRIATNGNVGIGTVDPSNLLHVYKANNDETSGILIEKASGGIPTCAALFFGVASTTETNNRGIPKAAIFYERNLVNGRGDLKFCNDAIDDTNPVSTAASDTRMIIKNNGNVGIGTVTPYAKLHVYGESGAFTTSGVSPSRASYFINSSALSVNTTGNFGAISIYGTGDILAGQYVGSFLGSISASDERIKKEIVDVEDGEALSTLRLLKPKRYKYRDEVKKGAEPVWGFIAQEVRDTLPYATQTRRECIPTIYELANVSGSNVITFTNFNTSNLQSNATSQIKLFDVENNEHLVKLVSVLDEHSIQVDNDLSAWMGAVDEDGNVVSGNQIFVYGEEVNDFVFLQKDAIWTVATSALQELDRQLQAEKTKVATLETQLTSVLTRLDALESA